MQIECSDMDTREGEVIDDFLTKGCGCKWSCHTKVGREAIEQRWASCAEFSRRDLDMVMLGQLAASEIGGGVERVRSNFHFEGKRVCKAMFVVVHGLGGKRFKNIKKHFSQNGISPRWHGNLGRVPRHAVTLGNARHAVTFLLEYTEVHAILLPGRVPGYKRTDLQVRNQISVNIHV